jgi:hypothetical protein
VSDHEESRGAVIFENKSFGERGRNRIHNKTEFQEHTGRQMTRKFPKSILNRVNSTQTARAL